MSFPTFDLFEIIFRGSYKKVEIIFIVVVKILDFSPCRVGGRRKGGLLVRLNEIQSAKASKTEIWSGEEGTHTLRKRREEEELATEGKGSSLAAAAEF